MIVAIVEIVVAIKLRYPPTEQQLDILNFLRWRGDLFLWIVRVFSMLAVWGGIGEWSRIIGRHGFKNISWLVGLILLVSPTMTVMWMCYPFLAVLWLTATVLLDWGLRISRPVLVVLLEVILIGIFNLKIIGYQPSIFNHLSLKQTQSEVTERIVREDSLNPRVEWPLWWRRISENKYFLEYRDLTAEVLPYFDLESVFFEEVHPFNQKSMVMFFWPEIILAIMGSYYLVNENNNQKLATILAMTTFLSIVNFLLSEGSLCWRLLLVMLPVSVLIAKGGEHLFQLSRKGYWLASLGVIVLVSLVGYGFEISNFDLLTRPEYWLDNRPIIYSFWFENIKRADLSQIKTIQITSLVGNPEKYCRYYFENGCESSKFLFKSFNLSEENIVTGTLYAGFSGEFVGPKFRNDISVDWQKVSEDKGLVFLTVKHTYDSVANQYGNDIGLAVKTK